MNKLYMKQYFLKLSNTIFDNVFFKAIISAILFFKGIHIYFLLVFGLVVLDAITGVAAALKRGERFTTKILNKGFIQKTCLYIIMILGTFALEYIIKSILPYEKFYFVFFVSTIISSYELISVFENCLVINPNFVFIKSFIKLTKTINKKTIKAAETAVDKFNVEDEKKKEDSAKETQ